MNNVTVLSAAPAYDLSRYPKKGKNIWIDNHLGVNVNRVITRRSKKIKYCKRGDILIDDYANTVHEWTAAGGIGILHTSASETIQQLKRLKL